MSNYKAPIRIIQSDFRSGELDPLFMMRVDSKAYPSGAQSLHNMLVNWSGSASRRPGMLTKASVALRPRLVEFEFDANEKYVCAFMHNALKIFTADGAEVASFTTAGTCPWTDATIFEIEFVQKGDVMIIVHGSFQIRRLKRTGLSTFILEIANFAIDAGPFVYNQPFMKFQRLETTVGVSSYYAEATPHVLTAVPPSGTLFSSAWIGERVQVMEGEVKVLGTFGTPSATNQLEVEIVKDIRKRLDPAPFRYTLSSPIVEITHAQHGFPQDADVLVTGATDAFGITTMNGHHIIVVLDSDHYRVNLGASIATGSGDGGGVGVIVYTTAQTRDWKEQVWSDRRGWPGAICLHENRLWLGGSPGAPTFLAGSVVGAYTDFSIGDGFDDESVQALISTTSRIMHMVSARTLTIFTENAEAIVTTQPGEPITPGSLSVTVQTSYGTSAVKPRLFAGAVLFCQRNGKNVRELAYDFQSDAYAALPVSGPASHMIDIPQDLAILNGTGTRPEQYAFFINQDGSCACYHAIRDNFAAWTPFTAGGGIVIDGDSVEPGLFTSVCVIGTSVFFAIKRGAEWHIDRLELDSRDVWLDGASTFTGTMAVWNVGMRYADRRVAVMSNGHWLGTYPVSSLGIVSLPVAVTDITIGFDYDVEVIPMPPDKELTDGPLTGEFRRIVSSTLHFHQSVSAAVNGHELLGFTIGQDPAVSPQLVTGKKRVRLLGYGRDPVITITQPAPGPMTVLGFSLEVSV